jgi:hypothetical protein
MKMTATNYAFLGCSTTGRSDYNEVIRFNVSVKKDGSRYFAGTRGGHVYSAGSIQELGDEIARSIIYDGTSSKELSIVPGDVLAKTRYGKKKIKQTVPCENLYLEFGDFYSDSYFSGGLLEYVGRMIDVILQKRLLENEMKKRKFDDEMRLMIDNGYRTERSLKNYRREGSNKSLGSRKMMKTDVSRIKRKYQGVRDRYHVSPLLADL